MKNISRKEAELMNEIMNRDMIVFTPSHVRRFLNISDTNANRIIMNMKRKELIENIERGKYMLKGVGEEHDIYEIASELFKPSYISFFSALHFHSMTEQVPRSVFLATTRRKRSLHFQGQEIKYVTLKTEMFFGYEKLGKVVVSDPEKTLIDCIRHPEYSGGVDTIFGSIRDDIDTEKVVEYCMMVKSSTIASRLGYMLELKDIDFDKDRLRSLISTYSKLDPGRGYNNPDKAWKLYLNRVME